MISRGDQTVLCRTQITASWPPCRTFDTKLRLGTAVPPHTGPDITIQLLMIVYGILIISFYKANIILHEFRSMAYAFLQLLFLISVIYRSYIPLRYISFICRWRPTTDCQSYFCSRVYKGVTVIYLNKTYLHDGKSIITRYRKTSLLIFSRS